MSSKSKNEICNVLANEFDLYDTPYSYIIWIYKHTMWKSASEFNMKKIVQGQIRFREYWITPLQPIGQIWKWIYRNDRNIEVYVFIVFHLTFDQIPRKFHCWRSRSKCANVEMSVNLVNFAHF